MRLINTSTGAMEEFYDEQTPAYAILSHRWGPPDSELSYTDYISGRKTETPGCGKMRRFCQLAREQGYGHCWIDTCCIDKTSRAELSEAINSMFRWYQRSGTCYAYLNDVSQVPDLERSEWFRRGWTLQELIAPTNVIFYNRNWDKIGSRSSLQQIVAHSSGIDEACLASGRSFHLYSVAQRMSWASHRATSRVEDEAYCLLGLFQVNLPLLYGEGRNSFRRLQEAILATCDDNSLFAWGLEYVVAPSNDLMNSNRACLPCASILAPSPESFAHSGTVNKGFASQRILFEMTNRGMMVLIHQSYNPQALRALLNLASAHLDADVEPKLGVTIPLGCFMHDTKADAKDLVSFSKDDFVNNDLQSCFLRLVLENGKWRRAGVSFNYDEDSWADYTGKHYFAYKNDYVRMYIHHDSTSTTSNLYDFHQSRRGFASQPMTWIHLQDDTQY